VQEQHEDLTKAVQILALTVNMMVESLNQYTLAIAEMNKRIEVLEQFMDHEQ